jgi:hypothetical protein
MNNATARNDRHLEVALLQPFVEKPKRVKYATLPRGVRPDEQIEIVQWDCLIA